MPSLNQNLRQSPIGRSPLLKNIYRQAQGLLRKVGVSAPVSPNDAGVVWYRQRSAWHLDQTSAAFVHHDDRSLLDLLIAKLNPGGKVIFYDRSNNWPETQLLIEALESRQAIVPVETYKNLRIYRRATVADTAVVA